MKPDDPNIKWIAEPQLGLVGRVIIERATEPHQFDFRILETFLYLFALGLR